MLWLKLVKLIRLKIIINIRLIIIIIIRLIINKLEIKIILFNNMISFFDNI